MRINPKQEKRRDNYKNFKQFQSICLLIIISFFVISFGAFQYIARETYELQKNTPMKSDYKNIFIVQETLEFSV